MYSIFLSEEAKKQFRKLEKIIQERIIAALERIKTRPEAFVVRLAGSPYYRLRVGDYRVILDIRKNELIILVIFMGHRRNVYKDF
jgi:mRNA interferase RelE/StbE